MTNLNQLLKEKDLCIDYDDSKQHLTSNNFNNVIYSISSLFASYNNISNNINNLLSSNSNNQININVLSLNLENTLKTIENISTYLNQYIDSVSTNVTTTIVTNAKKAEQADSANFATNATSAEFAAEADYAKSIPDTLTAAISNAIIDLIPDSNDDQFNGTTAENLIISGYDKFDNETTYTFNGLSKVEIDKIKKSKYADIATEAKKLTNNITFKINDNQSLSFDGLNNISIDLISAANIANKLKNSLNIITSNIDTNEPFTFNGNQTLNIDLILSSIYANHASTADSATNANSATNAKKAEQADSATNAEHATEADYAKSIPNTLTAAISDAIIDLIPDSNGSQFNGSTSKNLIIYGYDNNDTETAYTFNGSLLVEIDKIKKSKYADIATEAKKLTNNITFKINDNQSLSFDGLSNASINKILSSVYSETSLHLNKTISYQDSNENTINISLNDDNSNYIINSIKSSKYASNDINSSLIHAKYEIKNECTLSHITILNNLNEYDDNNDIYNTLLNANFSNIGYICADKDNIIFSNKDKVYCLGSNLSNGMSTYKDKNSSVNNFIEIQNLKNVDYLYTISGCSIAISNYNLYVWGRNDNQWYGVQHNQYNIYIPTIVNHVLIPNNINDVYNTYNINYYTIKNNSDQNYNISFKKAIKCPFSFGALALSTDGKLYGCGKNKKYLFGKQFKENEIFYQWIYLPINYIINANNDKIKDISIVYNDNAFIISLHTQLNHIYIFDSNNNQQQPIFTDKINSESTDNTEIIKEYINCYTSLNQVIKSSWYRLKNIICSTYSLSLKGIIYTNNNNINYKGLNIFENKSDIIQLSFNIYINIDNNQTKQLEIIDNIQHYNLILLNDKLYFIFEDDIYLFTSICTNINDFITDDLQNQIKQIINDNKPDYILQFKHINILHLNTIFINNYCNDSILFVKLDNGLQYDIENVIFNNGNAGIICTIYSDSVSSLYIDDGTSSVICSSIITNDDDEQLIFYSTNINKSVVQYEKLFNNTNTEDNKNYFQLIPNQIIFNYDSTYNFLNLSRTIDITSCYILYYDKDNNIKYITREFNNNCYLDIQHVSNDISIISAVYYNEIDQIWKLFVYDTAYIDLEYKSYNDEIQFNLNSFNSIINNN